LPHFTLLWIFISNREINRNGRYRYFKTLYGPSKCLTDEDSKDYEAIDLHAELIIFRSLVNKNQTPLEVPSVIKNLI